MKSNVKNKLRGPVHQPGLPKKPCRRTSWHPREQWATSQAQLESRCQTPRKIRKAQHHLVKLQEKQSPSLLRAQRRRCQASSDPSWASSRASTARAGSGAARTRGCLSPASPNQREPQLCATERLRLDGTPARHLLQSPCASRALPEHMAPHPDGSGTSQGHPTAPAGTRQPSTHPPSIHPRGDVGHAGRSSLPSPSRSRG